MVNNTGVLYLRHIMKAGQTFVGSLKVFFSLFPFCPPGIVNSKVNIYPRIERISAKSLFIVRQWIYACIMEFFQALGCKKEFFYRIVFLRIPGRSAGWGRSISSLTTGE
jgi:hypothetical protein